MVGVQLQRLIISMPVLVLVLIDVSAMRLILYLTKTIEGSNSLRYSNCIKTYPYRIGIGDAGAVFIWCQINTKSCNTAQHYWINS